MGNRSNFAKFGLFFFWCVNFFYQRKIIFGSSINLQKQLVSDLTQQLVNQSALILYLPVGAWGFTQVVGLFKNPVSRTFKMGQLTHSKSNSNEVCCTVSIIFLLNHVTARMDI
jgi:hypothetical protein